MQSSSEHFPAGTVIGADFEIVRTLGEGGMGTVYVAVQRGTGAKRAVKVMRPALLDDPLLRQRFEQEARVGSRIRSDHIVQVVSAGVDEAMGIPWIAMELLDGCDLAAYLRKSGAVDPADAYLIFTQLCHALAAAHEVGVVHRDLKPENVFLATSRIVGMPFVVKVLDFGVAKLVSEAKGVTMTLGTPSYMAPEQSQRSGHVGPQTDVWALGLIFFQLLTGKSFWRAVEDPEGSPAMLLREVVHDPIPKASQRAAVYKRAFKLPAGFDGWFDRCVARDVGARFRDAREAHEALDALLAAAGPSMERATTGVRFSAGFASTSAKVTFKSRSERTIVEAQRGSTLLDVAIDSRIPIVRACGGKGQCTTCRVLILDGESHLSGRTEAEAKIAGEQGFASNIRLACQARVNGDVTLRRTLEEAEGTHEFAEPSQALPAQRREVVALYCGLRGARAFVAGGYPHDVVHVVNRCLRQITEPILANRGAVERYMGERILALFGADGADPRESAVNALRASLRAAARLRHLNQTLVRRFNHTLDIGVGLHADSVVMGQAFPAMTHLGALGDVDEVATRIERAAHAAGVLIGASPSFLRLVGQDVTTGKAFAVEGRPGEAPMEGVEIVNFVKPDAVLIVQSTFERVAPSADAFARMFYDRLFDESDDVAALFEHVDMPVQRKMLMDVLAVAVRGLDRIESVVPILQELGRRHAGYGARTAHYKLVGEALIWSLQSFLKDDFTPEVELAWIEIYGIIAKTMIDATKSPDGRAVA